VAAALRRRRWAPGIELSRQGSKADEFFLVESGRAFVFSEENQGEPVELTAGDYWGVRNMIKLGTVLWSLTVVSAGPEDLVTLSMSRKQFEGLGLHKKLRPPKRPALMGYSSGPTGETKGLGPAQVVSAAERSFLEQAITRNASLAVFSTETRINQLLAHAKKRLVSRGTQVGTSDAVANELLVVFKGSFDVLLADKDSTNNKGAEVAVMRSNREAEEAKAAKAPINSNRPTRERIVAQILLPQPVKASPQPLVLPISTSIAEDDFFKPEDFVKRANSTIQLSTPTANRNHPTRGRGRTVSMTVGGDELKLSAIQVGDTVTWANQDQKRKNVSSGGAMNKLRAPLVSIEENAKAGDVQMGVVVDVADQRVIVKFPHSHAEVVRPEELMRVDVDKDSMTLKSGDCFGEVSIVYNSHTGKTLRAKEDCVVLTVSRRAVKVAMRKENPAVKEYARLLDEVDLLLPLLQSQKWELARNCNRKKFKAGERVLSEGETRSDQSWYVVERGNCTISSRGKAISSLDRGRHFGEFSLLNGDGTQQVTVTAGVAGMDCVVLDVTILQELQTYMKQDSAEASATTDAFRPCPAVRRASSRISSTAAGGAGACALYYAGEESCRESQERRRGEEMPLHQLQTKKVLGSGGFGRVTLEEDTLRPGIYYALKKMKRSYIEQEDMTRRVAAEREIMSLLDSPFLIFFFRSYKDEDYVFFLMEPVLGGDLQGLLEHHPQVFFRDKPRGSATAFYCACIALALEHLHSHHIVYRDMKCENVLLDDRGYAKVCDLGFARYTLGKCHTFLGTPQYMAPEMIDAPHEHSFEVDWWALGVIAHELFTGMTPFDDGSVNDEDALHLLRAIRKHQSEGVGLTSLPRDVGASARSFVTQLLVEQPRKRLGAKGAGEVLDHKFFADIDMDALQNRSLDSPFKPDINLECNDQEQEDDDDDSQSGDCRAVATWSASGSQVMDWTEKF
jgi:cGMP-dependent protein kinase